MSGATILRSPRAGSPLAVRGRQQLEAYFEAVVAYEAARERAKLAAGQHHAWEPLHSKADMALADDGEEEARARMETAAAAALIALQTALAENSGDAVAREGLADYYWFQCQEAEADELRRGLRMHERLVQAYDDGKYAERLAGQGSLSLRSEPTGAAVTISDLVQDGFVRKLVNERSLGTTPVDKTPLPMGSYVLTVRMPGFRDVLYPVHIARNTDWDGALKLYPDAAIGPDFIHVPAGPFILGGDEEGTHGWALPRREDWADDFFIGRHPVTLGEYLAFLNTLAARDPAEAERRSPRRMPRGGTYFTPDDDGRFALPADDTHWRPDLPAFAISWNDAVAYCEWRSQQDGRQYRLPTELEWEKAARGVDGAWHPWGNRFDPCLCNMRDSREAGPGPVSIHEFPTDVSVYGVRGMGGNVRDWTCTEVNDGQGETPELGFQRWVEAKNTRIVKGGAWSPLRPRSADRYWLAPDLVFSFIGFRLVAEPFTMSC